MWSWITSKSGTCQVVPAPICTSYLGKCIFWSMNHGVFCFAQMFITLTAYFPFKEANSRRKYRTNLHEPEAAWCPVVYSCLIHIDYIHHLNYVLATRICWWETPQSPLKCIFKAPSVVIVVSCWGRNKYEYKMWLLPCVPNLVTNRGIETRTIRTNCTGQNKAHTTILYIISWGWFT